jgi:hypothetical protein
VDLGGLPLEGLALTLADHDSTGQVTRVTSTVQGWNNRSASPRVRAPTCHWKNRWNTTSWTGSKKGVRLVVAMSMSLGNLRSRAGADAVRSPCQSAIGVLAATARIRRSCSAARSTM